MYYIVYKTVITITIMIYYYIYISPGCRYFLQVESFGMPVTGLFSWHRLLEGQCGSAPSPILRLSTIPWCVCAMLSLFIHLLVNISAVSTSWLLGLLLQGTYA